MVVLLYSVVVVLQFAVCVSFLLSFIYIIKPIDDYIKL